MEIFRDITEHTLGINHINVFNVIKLSHKREVFCNIPERTERINHFNMVNVLRISPKGRSFILPFNLPLSVKLMLYCTALGSPQYEI